jgi:diguanylate cyclase (GGDEF)-like protein
MKAAPPHPAEAPRLQTVNDLSLLDPRHEATFDRVVQLARRYFRVPICAFSVIDASRQVFKASEGIDLTEAPRGLSFCAHAILGEDILCIPDASLDPRFADNPVVTGPLQLRFYAGAPVFASNGLPVGALCVIDRVPRRFDDEQLQALRSFADIIQDELVVRTLPVRDPLTGLYNRRFADHALRTELRRAYRGQLPLTVLEVDVDNLQRVNDRLGQRAGDALLRRVAEQLSLPCRRPGDLVARFEDDKFLIALPDTNIEDARSIAEQIRDQIRELQPAESTDDDGVTASIGGVVVRDIAQLGYGPELILNGADRLLDRAKRGGCDCAVIEELR